VLIALGQRKVGAALDAVQRAERIDDQLRDVLALRAADALRGGFSRSGAGTRFLPVLLMVVNAAATAIVLATPTPDAGAPDGTTLVLALLSGALLGGVEAACAVALGSRLSPNRQRQAEPRHPWRTSEAVTLANGAALAVLSIPAGWAIFIWTQARVAPHLEQLGVLLGLTLALHAWIAPWLLVQAAFGSADHGRRSQRLDRYAAGLVAERERERTTAFLAVAAARTALARADRVVAKSAEWSAAPMPANRTPALRRLAAAVAGAAGAYTALHARPIGAIHREASPGR
jgi:hypothetical protein